MGCEESRASRAYLEYGSCCEHSLDAKHSPAVTWVSFVEECIQKCREHAESKENYDQLAKLHLDCAELGIDCDSAALILYERHMLEDYG